MIINNQYQKVAPFILFILALVLLFYLIRPMISILLGSILLAYISFPLYNKLIKKLHNKSLSIILSLFLVSLVILIPFIFLTVEITQQGYYFYNSLSNNIVKGELFGFGCTSAESKVCSIINQFEKFSLERLSTFGFDNQLQKFLPIFEEKITRFILSIPIILAGILLTLTIAYFILKDWKGILKRIIELLPMRTKTMDKLIKEFGSTASTVIYAQLFVAFIQGVVGAIGFYIFGVPFPIILGLTMAFFALIPVIGTAIIWVPVSLFMILIGYFSGDHGTLWRGIGLFLYGTFVISLIDNVLLAKIVHARAEVNQIIVITGVVGGAAMFGVVGIFVGPILLSLLITYFKTFKDRLI